MRYNSYNLCLSLVSVGAIFLFFVYFGLKLLYSLIYFFSFLVKVNLVYFAFMLYVYFRLLVTWCCVHLHK